MYRASIKNRNWHQHLGATGNLERSSVRTGWLIRMRNAESVDCSGAAIAKINVWVAEEGPAEFDITRAIQIAIKNVHSNICERDAIRRAWFYRNRK